MNTIPPALVASIELESLREAYAYARNKLAAGECYAHPILSASDVRAELYQRGMHYTRHEVIDLCRRHGYVLVDV